MLAGIRYLLAALILLAAMGSFGSLKEQFRGVKIWPIIVYGLLQTAGAFGFLTLSMALIAPGRASIINNTHPFYTLVMARVFLGERITGRKIISLLLGFVGIFLVLSPTMGGCETHPVGNAFALFAALCFSLANTFGRKISRHYDTRVLTAGQMLAGSGLLLVLSGLFERSDILHVSFAGWVVVVYLAVFSSLLPYLIWTHLLKFYEASRLSLFVFSVPLMASVLSFFVFGERFSLETLSGLGLIAKGGEK
jgi:drug/metabolite transporter (DMT)-like permease